MSAVRSRIGPCADDEGTSRGAVRSSERPDPCRSSAGFTLWLTGLSGSGKSTLAAALADVLRSSGRPIEILDGDEVRRTISRDLGFTKADRDKNVRRIGAIAQFLSASGTIVIVAAISPYRDVRHEIRDGHAAPFVEVFVDCPLAELVRRDTKGLYARSVRGELPGLSGVADPYEPPLDADVIVHTHDETAATSTARILQALHARGLVAAEPR